MLDSKHKKERIFSRCNLLREAKPGAKEKQKQTMYFSL